MLRFITVRAKIIVYFAGLALLLAALGFILWQLADGRNRVMSAEARHERLVSLAFELRQTASDLTRTARTFAVTSDSDYHRRYHEVLGIRDGKRTRPVNYNYLYWDLHPGKRASSPHPLDDTVAARAVPLVTLLHSSGLSNSERSLLHRIAASDSVLQSIEAQAFAAAQGHYAADSAAVRRHEFLVVGEPSLSYGRDLLYGPEYLRAKVVNTDLMGQFIQSVDLRASQSTLRERQEQEVLWFVAVGITVLMLLYWGFGIYLSNRSIAQPLGSLVSLIRGREPDLFVRNTGEIESLSVVYDDLVERLRNNIRDLEEAHRRQEAHAREISSVNEDLTARTSLLIATLDNISQGVSVFDKNLKLVTWNEQVFQLYGFPTEFARVGTSLERFLSFMIVRKDLHGPLESSVAWWADHARTGKPFMIEMTLANERTVELRGQTTPEGLLVTTFADMSQRKVVDRMKNEFISTVSHELRTPLTSIAGSLGLLSAGKAGDLPEKASKLIGIAYNSSQRLVRLINDILDLEKIEAGKMVYKFAPVSLLPIVEHCIEANRGYADGFGVRCELDPTAVDGTVRGDVDRLTQVFTNLLSNAAKFSPSGSTVDVDVRQRNGMLRVTVRDYGKGIPAEFQQMMFARFAQADATDQRKQGGTGLGLNIAKNIVDRHHGRISFETTDGEGTAFFVDLPLVQQSTPLSPDEVPPDHADSHEPQPAERKGLPHVLHVEDDFDIQQVVRASLEGVADVEQASSIAEARGLLRMESFDLVILDVQLGDGSGLDLLPLPRRRDGSPTPAIIFSVDETTPPSSYQIVAALTKSRVSIDELARRVRRALAPWPPSGETTDQDEG